MQNQNFFGGNTATALAPQQFGTTGGMTTGGPGMAMPPQVAPQVYAQNPNCGLPSIQTFVQPPCPDPRTSLQINKRVFITVTAGILVIDYGNAMVAGFGAEEYGRVATAPAPGTFNLTTDSTTIGFVRDITIAFDPFATDDFLGNNLGVASAPQELLRSFGYSFSALLAGQVTVENTPFPTVIPVASAIKNVGGMDSYWTVGNPTIQNPSPASEPSQNFLGDLMYVSPVMEATHAHAPAPIEIYLPTSSSFRVLISVPNRSANTSAPINPGQYAGYVYVWSGVITVLQENNTLLGAVSGAQPSMAYAGGF